jgi:hypothetical protein
LRKNFHKEFCGTYINVSASFCTESSIKIDKLIRIYDVGQLGYTPLCTISPIGLLSSVQIPVTIIQGLVFILFAVRIFLLFPHLLRIRRVGLFRFEIIELFWQLVRLH